MHNSLRTSVGRLFALIGIILTLWSSLAVVPAGASAGAPIGAPANFGSTGPGSVDHGVTTGRAVVGRGGFSVSNPYEFAQLPKYVHQSTLGTLYRWAKAGQISSAVIDPTNYIVFFTHNGGRRYGATFLAGTEGVLQQHLLTAGVNVSVGAVALTYPSSTRNTVLALLPLVGIVGAVLFIVIRRRRRYEAELKLQPVSGGVAPKTSKGRSGAQVIDIPTTRFSDVAGCPEALADLSEFVQFLKEPERFAAVGATIPKGALLSGPPGTGKTLLARAVAGEAGVPFFATSGADFTEMYVGVGAKRIRELFAAARKAERAIIFIDEIDAVARRRSDRAVGGESERDNTLVALLSEMDGFNSSGVIVIAATNRPDVLDAAVTRPGRLDRRIEVPNPDRRGREQILKVHTRNRPIDEGVNLEAVARRTSGMSGAELAGVVNEACIEAAREGVLVVTSQHFDAAIATTAMGRARTSAVVTEHDRLVTAWHEAGHTVCAYVQEGGDKPVSVSIIPRGPAGGVTWMSEGDDQFLQRSKASARLVTALGGRAAEEMLLGDDYTQGAYGDLTTATRLATAMATQYGMTSLGLMVRDVQSLGNAAADGVTDVVEELLEGALCEARRLLAANTPFMAALVAALLDNDTLDAEGIEAAYAAGGGVGAGAPLTVLHSLNQPRVVRGTTTRETVVREVMSPIPTPTVQRRRSGLREQLAAAISGLLTGRGGTQPPVRG